jgi:hypothetical protein
LSGERGQHLPVDATAVIRAPLEPAQDVYWEPAGEVVSERRGFNGIGELEHQESGGASAGWLVTVPSWQFGYLAVESEVARSVPATPAEQGVLGYELGARPRPVLVFRARAG